MLFYNKKLARIIISGLLYFIMFSYYFIPCINFLIPGLNIIINIPATVGTTVNINKKVVMSYLSVTSSILPPIVPANLLPIAIAKYHIPYMKAIILPGTNLLT